MPDAEPDRPLADTIIRGLRTRVVEVPLPAPVAIGRIRAVSTTMILIDVEADGMTGRAYLHAFQPTRAQPLVGLLAAVGEIVAGQSIAPAALHDMLMRRLGQALGREGALIAAIGGFDMACWDLLGQQAGLPLVRLLGGDPGAGGAPTYRTSALGSAAPGPVAVEAGWATAHGFAGFKIQLGHPTVEEDAAVIRAVRAALAPGMALMVDYVQGLSVAEAIRRGRALDALNLTWIEDPIPYDDLAGHARIAREVLTPIQLGENFYGPRALAAAIAAEASDYAMIDLPRIGGVTGWLRAAALAEAAQMPMSSHLYPEFAAHLLAVTPTRHWMEHTDLAKPILAEPLTIRDGRAVIPDRPGVGIAWNEDAVARYLVTQ